MMAVKRAVKRDEMMAALKVSKRALKMVDMMVDLMAGRWEGLQEELTGDV